METVTAPTTFDAIGDKYYGAVFPRMEDCQTALCLFTAMWHGRQDVYWLAREGITGVAVDLEERKLAEMRAVYPEGWEFVTADAFEYAEAAAERGQTWDVVTLDPWSGQFEKCAELLPLWCSLANKVVALGFGNYRLSRPSPPPGWRFAFDIRRSDFKGGVYWLVFKKKRRG